MHWHLGASLKPCNGYRLDLSESSDLDLPVPAKAENGTKWLVLFNFNFS